MIFNVYVPQKLHGLVDSIWEHQSSQPCNWTILPSGKIELMFRIGAPPDLTKAKKIANDENPMKSFAFMSGLQTNPISMALDSMHFIGVRMSPIAFKAFFGIPLSLITDYYLPGTEFLKTLTEIEDRLNEAGPFLQKAHWLETFLYSNIQETADLHMAMGILQASETFLQSPTLQPNSSLESLLGYSRTHSFRIFKEWFGVSPHRYQRLQQFVNAIETLHHRSGSLTHTGLEQGYFDQSHFIRSFKSFSGITPSDYLKRMTHIPGQISG